MSKGYEAKGEYEEIGGYKTCMFFSLGFVFWVYSIGMLMNGTTDYLDVTGPADAEHAIIIVYDIFGYFEQTLQGADILAYGDDAHKYRVYMPDWFKGQPCPIEWYDQQPSIHIEILQ